jgi:hypothetical protein
MFVQVMQILNGPGIGEIPGSPFLNSAAQQADLLGEDLLRAEGRYE